MHFPLPQHSCDVNLGPIGVIRYEKAHVPELLTKGGTLPCVEASRLDDPSFLTLALSDFFNEVGVVWVRSVPALSCGSDARCHGRLW